MVGSATTTHLGLQQSKGCIYWGVLTKTELTAVPSCGRKKEDFGAGTTLFFDQESS